MTRQLFISHSTADDSAVDRLAPLLEAAGITLWVDHRHGIEPGAPNWDSAIRGAIAASDSAALLMSPQSLASDICAAECLLARELRKPLYVLLLEPCPPEAIWLYIKMVQYADLSADFDAGAAALIAALDGTGSADGPTPVAALDVPAYHAPSPLFRREWLENDITVWLDRLIERDAGSCHLLHGPSGIGKTTLLHQIGDHARSRNLHTLFADFAADDSLTGSATIVPDKLIEALWAQTLRLHPVAAQHREQADDKDSASLLRWLHRAIDEVARIDRPVVLLLDNLHLDAATFSEWLRRFEDTPVLIVATHLESAVYPVNKFDAFQVTRVEPFTPEELDRPCLPKDANYGQLLADLTDGNPREIQATIDALETQGAVERLQHLLRVHDPDALPGFWGGLLEEAILKALAQVDLDEDAETVEFWLSCAAMIGAEFKESVLLAAGDDIDPADGPALLHALADAGVLAASRAGHWRFEPRGLRYWLLAEADDEDLVYYGEWVFEALQRDAGPAAFAMRHDLLRVARATLDALYRQLLDEDRDEADIVRALARSKAMQQYNQYAGYADREARIAYWRAQLDLLVPGRRDYESRRAVLLYELGRAMEGYSHPGETLAIYEEALPLFRIIGDRAREAFTLNNIGGVYNALGDQDKALGYYGQALPLRRAVADRGGEAITLNNIGGVYNALGDQEKALDYFQQALPLLRAVGDRGGEATTLNNIGEVYRALGDNQQALDYLEQALPLFQAVGDRAGEAVTLNNIGAVYRALGEQEKALDYYEQSLPLRRAVGDRGGEAVTLSNIGRVYEDLGDKEKALDYYQQALPLSRAVGNRVGEATTCFTMGRVYETLGDLDKAIEYVARCVELDEQIGDPHLEDDRATLARLRALRDGSAGS